LNTISNTQIIGRKLIHYEQLQSTNDHALKLIAKSNPIEGTVISTDFQSSGKGQRNNIWQSEPSENLLFSIILYPSFLSVSKQFYLSMFTVNAITSLLETVLDPKKLFIKWPNDIYYENRKLGGILIQNNLKGENIESSVIGIGLNVNQKSFDPILPNPSSILIEKNNALNLKELLTNLLHHLDKNYLLLINNSLNQIKEKYESHLFQKGVKSRIKIRGKWVDGVILGIEEDGRIVINEEGRIKKFYH